LEPPKFLSLRKVTEGEMVYARPTPKLCGLFLATSYLAYHASFVNAVAVRDRLEHEKTHKETLHSDL
jgi:hypothetical protein